MAWWKWAVLLGQVLGAWLGAQQNHVILTNIAILSIAAIGYWVSCGVPHSPAADPQLKINWNPVTETFNNIQFV